MKVGNRTVNPLPEDVINESLQLDPSSPSWLQWKLRPRKHFSSNRGWNIFNSRHAWQPAKAETQNGKNFYWVARFNGKLYMAHRIVYFLATGIDPLGQHIDHIDGNGRNNNPSNLRLATHKQNLRNRGPQRNNAIGIKGVCWNKNAKKYVAQIKVDGRPVYLGLFDNIAAAAEAYDAASKKYFGDFHCAASK